MVNTPRIPTLSSSERADLERREGKSVIQMRAEAKALAIIDAQAELISDLERRLGIAAEPED